MSKRIVLISGHGAGDPGASGNGYTEESLTREVTTQLYNRLKKSNLSVSLYPQSKDLYKSKDWNYFTKNDEVIEVHFNAFNGTAKGTEVLIKTGYKPDKVDESLLTTLSKYFTNRGFKYRNDLQNMNTFASKGISYRLIEICFIDNYNDMKEYVSSETSIWDDLAGGIISAMNGKIQNTDTSTTPMGSGFLVKISIDDLNIRSGAGTNYQTTGKFTGRGTFTIIETKAGTGSSCGWGKLKSGAGWVSLDYCTRV